jgi:ABC-type multidrug transport system ATPase subunit
MLLTEVEKRLGDFFLSVQSLAVPGPGIYGLIGPNGSGKSTLAKLMAGIIEPDRGSIDTEGLDSRDITLITRKPYMMDDTVYNNLVYPLKLRKAKIDAPLVSGYLAKMGFSGREKQRARSLSGGEQQKLAFLRAIIFKPRFIIADEAMTAMDMDSLNHFENSILDGQKKEPVIWIIISHQMPHIRRLADHIFFMHQGKMEIQGSAEEIFHRGQPRFSQAAQLAQYLRTYGGGE